MSSTAHRFTAPPRTCWCSRPPVRPSMGTAPTAPRPGAGTPHKTSPAKPHLNASPPPDSRVLSANGPATRDMDSNSSSAKSLLGNNVGHGYLGGGISSLLLTLGRRRRQESELGFCSLCARDPPPCLQFACSSCLRALPHASSVRVPVFKDGTMCSAAAGRRVQASGQAGSPGDAAEGGIGLRHIVDTFMAVLIAPQSRSAQRTWCQCSHVGAYH
jgi:hypothetical protein